MTCKTSYELHHNFPKLAVESGFTFNTHRPRIQIDWNKIRLIDIESLIKDRKFVLIEQHVHDILDCVLESEFDVRILDEGVLKMFRLAQLSVEYHQFCRHYLDRSVFVLREEITSLIQELNSTKNHAQEKEDEIRKLRKKTKYSYRPPHTYGNDNIATMILRTLSNKEMFTSPLTNDPLQYNKCNFCEKVFMNQLYLQSHISRRHPDAQEVPQKDTDVNAQKNIEHNENTKLNDEVLELKNRLKDMESMIIQYNQNTPIQQSSDAQKPITNDVAKLETNTKEMKDAEVSTNYDISIIEKIEEWKRGEIEKHNSELNMLKTQILESITSLKEKESKQQSVSDVESQIVEQLRTTIKQQGIEINVLKQELDNTKKNTMHNEAESRRKIEEQMSFWVNKAEDQSKQYELLLHKLNDLAEDAQESRVLAETEKQRANKLQVLLEQSLNNVKRPDTKNITKENKVHYRKDNDVLLTDGREIGLPKKPSRTIKSNSKTLEQLHRKAQELLNIESSTSSESSINITVKHDKQNLLESQNISEEDMLKHSKKNKALHKTDNESNIQPTKLSGKKKKNNKSAICKNPKTQSAPLQMTYTIPASPVKVVRAKITEEVNNRLVTLGVDPLKNRIPRNIFQKQRGQLQQVYEKKTKGFPVREKIRNSLIAYLDTKAADLNQEHVEVPEYNSPHKIRRTSKLSSVLSNVKNKALSLVKSSHETSAKSISKTITSDVAKRAMSLLKTPPDTPVLSPTKNKLNFENDKEKQRADTLRSENKTQDARYKSTKKYAFNLQSDSESVNSEIIEDNKKPKKTENSFMDLKASESEDESSPLKETKSLDKLIKSPARRPSSASALSNNSATSRKDNVLRASSVTDLFSASKTKNATVVHEDSESEIESVMESPLDKKPTKQEMSNIKKQTKSVLKNASSTSSLNKKKVLFDMDAIQMKSVSASPSQSTEKSDDKEKFALGIINFDGDDWDISSIDEDEQLKNDTKIHVASRASPKITELKEAIESQLARRRNETPTVPVGGVDILKIPHIGKASSFGGSNTSLGSSILDESDLQSTPENHKALFKPKKVIEKEDSELDISEISIDGKGNKNDF